MAARYDYDRSESTRYTVEPAWPSDLGDWVLLRNGYLQADGFDTQARAVEFAKDRARNDRPSKLFIKTSDGQKIRKEISYD